MTLPGTQLNYSKSPLKRAVVSVGLSGHGFAHRGLLGAALCRSSWEGLNFSPRLPHSSLRLADTPEKEAVFGLF